ncbi:hypothetical protein [Streptomyces sp. DH10]|nr:hypothetical protein [Streptomyces sp. DH10]MDG9707689.1 hypothetical protein [Streptomyces sp. DH10]
MARSFPTALAAYPIAMLIGWALSFALIARLASLDPANAPSWCR